jgi:hypothetical protein
VLLRQILVLGALDQAGLGEAGEQTRSGVVVVEQVRATMVEQVVAEQQQPDVQEARVSGLFAILVRVAGRASAAKLVRTDDSSSSVSCSPARPLMPPS